MVPWHILNMFFIHWIITKVGFLFIDAEVLRRDNEELLDGLEEGVIILEKKSNDILYYNTAAASAQVSEQLPIQVTEVKKPELKAMAMKIDEKRFAKIDKSMFEASTVDTGITVNNL